MSADSVKVQKNFCSKQEFQFQLLSDPEKETIRAYEAIGLKKMYGREYEGILRVAYLIDENGKIEKAYEKVSPKTHADEVLKDLI
jgi:peroxiredoxin Q/BCP